MPGYKRGEGSTNRLGAHTTTGPRNDARLGLNSDKGAHIPRLGLNSDKGSHIPLIRQWGGEA